MPLPSVPDILALGFVAEEEKFDAIAAAEAIVIPSRYESLSYHCIGKCGKWGCRCW